MSERAPFFGDPDENRLEDEKKAMAYFEAKLKGEKLIEIPQEESCRIGIVVPVYNETTERILEQVESLINQEGVKPEDFEVIYVVNRKEGDGEDVILRNREVLDLLIWKNVEPKGDFGNLPEERRKVVERIRKDFNFFVVDKSSDGKRIKDCNVGKARNRGVAEESKRFFDQKKNGIIIQTDADVRFEDEKYLKKVIDIFDQDPDLLATSGELEYEFNPDTQDPSERERLKKEYEDLIRMKLVKRLTQFIENEIYSNPDASQVNFGGGSMISRSFETAVIGGLADLRAGEDTQFGRDLQAYAESRGKRVADRMKKLMLVTALRESDRTPVRYKVFRGRNEAGQPLIEKPFEGREIVSLVTVQEAYDLARAEAGKTEVGRKLVEYLEGAGQAQFRRP